KDGVEYFDLSSQANPVLGVVQYATKDDVSKCAASPSTVNCHWQDITLKVPETLATAGTGLTALHMRVFADQTVNPDFLAIEGKVRYSDALAAVIFAPKAGLPAGLSNIRTIYFRAVQKGSQIWGSFDLQDADGKTISLPTGTGGD